MPDVKHDTRCDITANRLIMDGVRRSDADFADRFQSAWRFLYPDAPVPTGEDGIRGMWVSTRVMLEVTDICLAAPTSLIVFARERILHYHILRLKPEVFVEDVRSAVLADLTRMNLMDRDGERMLDRTLRSFTSRVNPRIVEPARTNFNPRECALITEFYRYLVQRLAVNAIAARPSGTIAKRDPSAEQTKPQTAASTKPTEAKPSAANALVEVKKPQPPLVIAPTQTALVKAEAAEEKAAVPFVEKKADSEPNLNAAAPAETPVDSEADTTEKESRSGRRRRRNHPPEELEKRTIKRLEGQFAIDLLMATRVEPQDELIDDDDDSELDQFIEACSESTTYKNYTAEQCTELWNSVLNEDRVLFARGSLTALVDLRFPIIASRCLMMALVETKDHELSYLRTFVERAAKYCEAFRLDYKPEVINERLKKLCKNIYLVKDKLPMSVLELLRRHRQDIEDAYNLYVEQSDAEAQLREQEIARQVEDIRRKDALRRRNDQHAEIVRLIRDFGSNELGWLCMAVHGLTCSKDNLLYQLDGVLQKLEALGIEPFALDLVSESFDGANPAAKEVIDLSGHPLSNGVSYRLVQPGWKYQGEIVVWPKADRVNS